MVHHWFQVNSTSVAIEVAMFNKSTTRLPEAMFVQFNPAPRDLAWEAEKLGEWVSVSGGAVVPGGSKHLHGVSEGGVRITLPQTRGSATGVAAAKEVMTVSTLDSAVLNLGELTAYPSPVDLDPDVQVWPSPKAAQPPSFHLLWRIGTPPRVSA